MRVLVACEESQAVCKAFRELGHEAFSCDVLPCSGGHPEWHIQDDVIKHLDDGWDLMIAHPPCTYLTNAGAVHYYGKKAKNVDASLQNEILQNETTCVATLKTTLDEAKEANEAIMHKHWKRLIAFVMLLILVCFSVLVYITMYRHRKNVSWRDGL